jgi:hypothetical protein
MPALEREGVSIAWGSSNATIEADVFRNPSKEGE